MKESQEIKLYYLEHDGKRIDIPSGIVLRYEVVQQEFRGLVHFPRGYAILIESDLSLSDLKRMVCDKIVDAIFIKPVVDDYLGHLLRRDYESLKFYWQDAW